MYLREDILKLLRNKTKEIKIIREIWREILHCKCACKTRCVSEVLLPRHHLDNISRAGCVKCTNSIFIFQFNKLTKLKEDQRNLPIKQYEDEIVYAVKTNQVVLVAGDTGCGKSTQVCIVRYSKTFE